MLSWKQLKNFKSDGCTAAPDLFWRDCCEEHDLCYKYHKELDKTRRQSDKELYQ